MAALLDVPRRLCPWCGNRGSMLKEVPSSPAPVMRPKYSSSLERDTLSELCRRSTIGSWAKGLGSDAGVDSGQHQVECAPAAWIVRFQARAIFTPCRRLARH